MHRFRIPGAASSMTDEDADRGLRRTAQRIRIRLIEVAEQVAGRVFRKPFVHAVERADRLGSGQAGKEACSLAAAACVPGGGSREAGSKEERRPASGEVGEHCVCLFAWKGRLRGPMWADDSRSPATSDGTRGGCARRSAKLGWPLRFQVSLRGLWRSDDLALLRSTSTVRTDHGGSQSSKRVLHRFWVPGHRNGPVR